MGCENASCAAGKSGPGGSSLDAALSVWLPGLDSLLGQAQSIERPHAAPWAICLAKTEKKKQP